MKYIFAFSLFFATSPLVIFAIERPKDIQEFGLFFITFTQVTLVRFLFSLALLFFIYNVVRYFIVAPGNDIARENAKRYAIYSISAFVLMVGVWGIVNLFVGGFGFNRADPVCPDIPGIDCEAWRQGGAPTRSAPPASGDGSVPPNGSAPEDAENTSTSPDVVAAKVVEYEAAVDLVVADLQASGMSTTEIENLTEVLQNVSSSDQAKVDRLFFFLDNGSIEGDTYSAGLSAVNNLRSVSGKPDAVFPRAG